MRRSAMKQSDTATILYGFKHGEGTLEERVRGLTDVICNSTSCRSPLHNRAILEILEDVILRFTEAEIQNERERIKGSLA
jgi:hypothetical protein